MPVQILSAKKSSVKDRFKNLDLSTSYSIVTSARKGVNPKVFYEFADTIKMPEKVLASIINLSSRTISNYTEQHKSLDPVNSEHLLKLIGLYDSGETIFGSVDEFNYWLRKPLWNSKETPFDWITTPGGVDLVSDELANLAEGYPV